MPRKKTSRAATGKSKNSKTLPVDPKLLEKKKSILEGFHMESKATELEILQVKETLIQEIIQMYDQELLQMDEATKNTPYIQYITSVGIDTKSKPKTSIDYVLSCAEEVLKQKKCTKKKKGANVDDAFAVPNKITRSCRPTKQKTVLGINQERNIISTAQTRRQRKIIAETPVNTQPPAFHQHFITPKFDTRIPLPATTLRKPRAGEIVVSLTGSPVIANPAKDWFHSALASQSDPAKKKMIEEVYNLFQSSSNVT